jgi:hypothetical protein
MFLIAGVSVKLILYMVLLFLILKMRGAVNLANKQDILNYYRYIKCVVYLLLILSYFMFISKFFEVKHLRHTGINSVDLSLITVMFVFLQQLDKAIADLQLGKPVAQETIDLRFTNVETLSYALIIFNYFSNGLHFITNVSKKLF